MKLKISVFSLFRFLITLLILFSVMTGCVKLNGKSSSTQYDKQPDASGPYTSEPDGSDKSASENDPNSDDSEESVPNSENSDKLAESTHEITMKQDLLCLMTAYPGCITDLIIENDKVYAVLSSGTKLLYDDNKSKTYEEKISSPDIQDTLEQLYPLGPIYKIPDKNNDPGSIRMYELLKEVYGKTRSQIESNLTQVSFGWKNISFNKQNGTADNLKSLMEDLNKLGKTYPGILDKVFPADGSYNYRTIAGTNRLSPHSFGFAIDLKVNTNDYWQWATQEKGQKRLESYPYEIAEKFESYGFIWGGKWNHFDIMHYEYRPEIIFKAKYFSEYYTEPKLGNSSNQPEDNTQKQRASWHKSMTDDLPTALTYANQIDILFK